MMAAFIEIDTAVVPPFAVFVARETEDRQLPMGVVFVDADAMSS